MINFIPFPTLQPFFLTKLSLFREVKRYVITPMNQGQLSAARAGEILKIVEQKILDIKNPGEVNALCIRLSEMFPELAILKKKLELQKEEQLDGMVALLAEELIGKGNLTLASLLFDEMKAAGTDQAQILSRLQSLCPIELKAVQERKNRS